jgi:ACS family hexuronate transporter-like MFS transporter
MALMMGWKATFLIAGGLGLVWVVVWLAVRLPEQPQSDAEAPTMAWSALLTDRRQWAIILGKALTDQVWWFLLFFLPDLFHRVFGLDQSALGLPVALVYAMAAVGGITAGFLPAALMGRGWSVNAARKVTMLIYAVMVLPVPLLIHAQSPWLAAFIVGVALFAHQGFSTSLFGLTTDVFPAGVVGSAIGIGAFAGNLSGMAMIEFTGWSLDAGHGYLPMLLICAVTYLAALGVIHLLLPRFTAIGGDKDGASPSLPTDASRPARRGLAQLTISSRIEPRAIQNSADATAPNSTKMSSDQRTPSAGPSPNVLPIRSLTAPTPSGPRPSPIRLTRNSSTAAAVARVCGWTRPCTAA